MPLGGAISSALPTGSRVDIQVIGNTIKAWVDSGGGWQLAGTRADATYAGAGYIGAELYGGSGRSLDDFGGGTTP